MGWIASFPCNRFSNVAISNNEKPVSGTGGSRQWRRKGERGNASVSAKQRLHPRQYSRDDGTESNHFRHCLPNAVASHGRSQRRTRTWRHTHTHEKGQTKTKRGQKQSTGAWHLSAGRRGVSVPWVDAVALSNRENTRTNQFCLTVVFFAGWCRGRPRPSKKTA